MDHKTIKVSSLGVMKFDDEYIERRQIKLLRIKESALNAIKKFPPSKEVLNMYDAIIDATEEWDILYRSAQVADMIREMRK